MDRKRRMKMSPTVVNLLMAGLSIGAYILNHFGLLPAPWLDTVLAITGWNLAGAHALNQTKNNLANLARAMQVLPPPAPPAPTNQQLPSGPPQVSMPTPDNAFFTGRKGTP